MSERFSNTSGSEKKKKSIGRKRTKHKCKMSYEAYIYISQNTKEKGLRDGKREKMVLRVL